MRAYIVEWLVPRVGPDAAAILAPTWFTFTGLAGLVTCALAIRAARRQGDDVALVVRALLAAYVAAVLGGILIPMAADTLMHALRGGGLRVRWAGMVSYCGFLSALAATALVLRGRGTMTLARFGDLMAAPLGAAVVIARTGCFTAGCDYGQVSAVPWALRFPAGSPAWSAHVDAGLVAATRDASLPVHPTQLYEAFLGVVIIGVARSLSKTEWARRRHGRVFLAIALTYGAGRLVIEMFRGDVSRGLVGAMSTGQIFSLLLLVAAVAALWYVRRAPAAALAAALAMCVTLPPGAARADGAERSYEVGALVGTSLPLNRRSNQVPQLSGGALTGNVELRPGIAVGVDLDSVANSVATHVSLGAFAGFRRQVHPRLDVGVRGGLGFTYVDFQDESFLDVATMFVRVGATAEWSLSERWKVLVRPMSFDVVNSAELGGPIVAYQFHAGVTYRFGGSRAPAPSSPRPAAPAASPPAESLPAESPPAEPPTPGTSSGPGASPAPGAPLEPMEPPEYAAPPDEPGAASEPDEPAEPGKPAKPEATAEPDEPRSSLP